METRRLGTSAVEVSRIALGCGTFGGIGTEPSLVGRGLTAEAAFAAMDEAAALGVVLFDTAHGYAAGRSELIIGQWLARQPGAVRSAIKIATKVGAVEHNGKFRVDLSPRCIRRQLGESLERLGIDCVDLCLTHFPDPATPIEATLEALAEQMAAGRITAIGACNVSARGLRQALEASVRLGLPRYAAIQNEYNLLERTVESGVLALCERHQVGMMAYSPISGGKLSGKYVPGALPDRDSRVALWPGSRPPSAAEYQAIERLREIGGRRGVGPGAVALAWVLTHPPVTSAAVGPSRTPEHLRLAREALQVELDGATARQIAGWFDTPGS
jgi:1-deoxyxylulose-5-phosphate synthase